MTDTASSLYVGAVVHQRFAPRRHRLRYRLFQLLIDLDELADLPAKLRLFSHNRFNVFSFHDRDHGDGRARDLRDYVRETLADAGIDIGGGKIRLLCMPRLFGHVFNPLSIYYCHSQDGALAAMLYEVTNTYRERHSYLIAVSPAHALGPIRQTCAKALFVSPFMDLDMIYDFTVDRPGDVVTTAITVRDATDRPMMVASFAGRRRPLSDVSLAVLLSTHPLLTVKVVAAIHWEAARLFFKGVKLRPHPPAPAATVSVVPPTAA